jgi:hypothetical protein
MEITGIGESDGNVITNIILFKRTVLQILPPGIQICGSSFAPLTLNNSNFRT